MIDKTKATLIKVDGTETELTPKSGSTFTFEGELYPLIDTDMIEVAPICNPDYAGMLLLVDEEGKLKTHAVNVKASGIAGIPGDYIAGNAVLMPSHMLD